MTYARLHFAVAAGDYTAVAFTILGRFSCVLASLAVCYAFATRKNVSCSIIVDASSNYPPSMPVALLHACCVAHAIAVSKLIPWRLREE